MVRRRSNADSSAAERPRLAIGRIRPEFRQTRFDFLRRHIEVNKPQNINRKMFREDTSLAMMAIEGFRVAQFAYDQPPARNARRAIHHHRRVGQGVTRGGFFRRRFRFLSAAAKGEAQ